MLTHPIWRSESCGERDSSNLRRGMNGKILYYRGKRFHSLKGVGFESNYYGVETGEDYWISGCKENGRDRLYGERVPVEIAPDVRKEERD